MNYIKPNIEILQSQLGNSDITEEYISKMRDTIMDVLTTFDVKVQIVGHRKSPLNVIYELMLGKGQRFSDLKNLKKEIEVALGSPAKFFQSDEASQYCYLAIPHDIKEIVRIREVISSEQFLNSESDLFIAAGIQENGEPVFIDLEESPHMLITGTTGSGKTVFLDVIICSLL